MFTLNLVGGHKVSFSERWDSPTFKAGRKSAQDWISLEESPGHDIVFAAGYWSVVSERGDDVPVTLDQALEIFRRHPETG